MNNPCHMIGFIHHSDNEFEGNDCPGFRICKEKRCMKNMSQLTFSRYKFILK